MPRSCCVRGCKYDYYKREYDLVFSFLFGEEKRKMWIKKNARQILVVTKNKGVSIGHFIDQQVLLVPVLCEASYVLLEYARTSMFMWMFVEGLYLHNAVTVTMLKEGSYLLVYSLLGWGVPVLMTAAWAATTAVKYGGSNRCWWGYNLTPYFWILEGPRLGVIVLNFLFLLNIIRVLVVKLRQSRTSEIQQLRKAVRAAVVLLPLLGITNLVNMADAPLDRAAWEFALWSYATHFLVSFQGFFIACLYCFLNGEVRLAILKSVWVYLSLQHHQLASATPGRRPSAFSGVYVTAELRQPQTQHAAINTVGAPAAWSHGRKRKTGEADACDVEECEEERRAAVSQSPAGRGPAVDAVQAAGCELEARDQRLSHGSVAPALPPAYWGSLSDAAPTSPATGCCAVWCGGVGRRRRSSGACSTLPAALFSGGGATLEAAAAAAGATAVCPLSAAGSGPTPQHSRGTYVV